MAVHLGVGIGLCLLTWIGLRLLVGAPLLGTPGRYRFRILALDAFPITAGFLLALAGTARPILASLMIVAPGIGLAIADRIKRAVLDEPTLFADRAELLEVVRHPRLYLAFVGTTRMVLGAAAILLAVGALFRFEPPLWHLPLALALLAPIVAIVIARALFVLPALPAQVNRSAREYARWQPSRDPAIDAIRFGLLATFFIQATLAAAERPARQQAAQARTIRPFPADAGPILLVQAESFMRADRLDPSLAGLTPNFAALQERSAQHGLLEVPCWGANTIRSELAMLGGLGADALGLDRFNPYEYFAHVPLPSLAQAARAAGYRTICFHPYERRFYLRDEVMPMLGFDEFIAIEGFADAPRSNGYVTDVAVAEKVAALVRVHGPKLLVFAITMENHGPWSEEAAPVALPPRMTGAPQAAALGHWLQCLSATDAMIPILETALRDAGSGWMLFYGDHQPSLAGAFATLGLQTRQTDYAIWSPAQSPVAQIDLPAEALGEALLDRIYDRGALSVSPGAAPPASRTI